MKKRENSLKNTKAKTHQTSLKKTTTKIKRKEKPREDDSYFILVGDQFYVASSKTERKTFSLYEEKAKAFVPTNISKKMNTTKESMDHLNPREYVSSLTKLEKKELLQEIERDL